MILKPRHEFKVAETTSPNLFTFGDIVLIDEKDEACINNIFGETGDPYFRAQFIIDPTEQINISQHRSRVLPFYYSNSIISSCSSRSHRHSDVPNVHISPQNLLMISQSTRHSPFKILEDTKLATKSI